MIRLETLVKVLETFRVLDVSGIEYILPKYPGKWHTVRELSGVSGLSSTTVREVLRFLFSSGYIDIRYNPGSPNQIQYRLNSWDVRFGDFLITIGVGETLVKYSLKRSSDISDGGGE